MYKRLTSLILSLLLVLAVALPTAAEPLVRGDVTYDDYVTAEDALVILQIAVKKKPITTGEYENADVNLDGRVDAYDALFVLQLAVRGDQGAREFTPGAIWVVSHITVSKKDDPALRYVRVCNTYEEYLHSLWDSAAQHEITPKYTEEYFNEDSLIVVGVRTMPSSSIRYVPRGVLVSGCIVRIFGDIVYPDAMFGDIATMTYCIQVKGKLKDVTHVWCSTERLYMFNWGMDGTMSAEIQEFRLVTD